MLVTHTRKHLDNLGWLKYLHSNKFGASFSLIAAVYRITRVSTNLQLQWLIEQLATSPHPLNSAEMLEMMAAAAPQVGPCSGVFLLSSLGAHDGIRHFDGIFSPYPGPSPRKGSCLGQHHVAIRHRRPPSVSFTFNGTDLNRRIKLLCVREKTHTERPRVKTIENIEAQDTRRNTRHSIRTRARLRSLFLLLLPTLKVYDNADLPDLIERNLSPMGMRMLVAQLGQVNTRIPTDASLSVLFTRLRPEQPHPEWSDGAVVV